MKLSINLTEIPFTIGDTVWVNQVCGETGQYPYFQGQIVQIILDGSLIDSIVIRQAGKNHELLVSSGIYDMKPLEDCARFGRITVTVDFLKPQTMLFETEKALLTYRKHQKSTAQRDQLFL